MVGASTLEAPRKGTAQLGPVPPRLCCLRSRISASTETGTTANLNLNTTANSKVFTGLQMLLSIRSVSNHALIYPTIY